MGVIDLASLDGSVGSRIDGAAAGDGIGRSVSYARDVKGDGIDETIIGGPAPTPPDAPSAPSRAIGIRDGATVAADRGAEDLIP